jgi:hypothetical protein
MHLVTVATLANPGRPYGPAAKCSPYAGREINASKIHRRGDRVYTATGKPRR